MFYRSRGDTTAEEEEIEVEVGSQQEKRVLSLNLQSFLGA